MPRIPSPALFRLDPNDENLILAMPTDPSPDYSNSDFDSTPKKVTSHFTIQNEVKFLSLSCFEDTFLHWSAKLVSPLSLSS